MDNKWTTISSYLPFLLLDFLSQCLYFLRQIHRIIGCLVSFSHIETTVSRLSYPAVKRSDRYAQFFWGFFLPISLDSLTASTLYSLSYFFCSAIVYTTSLLMWFMMQFPWSAFMPQKPLYSEWWDVCPLLLVKNKNSFLLDLSYSRNSLTSGRRRSPWYITPSISQMNPFFSLKSSIIRWFLLRKHLLWVVW